MNAARSGPGSGPDGVPAAIALTPILSGRYREADLASIAAAAPGAQLVSVSHEGLADAPLDEVEVLLRGPLSQGVFERLIARCPRLAWVHSASAGVERVLTAATASRGVVITNARGVFSQPIAEYVLMMMLAVNRGLPQLLELQRERTWQPLDAREMRDVTVGVVGLGSIGRAVARLAATFGSRVVATRRHPDPASGAADGEAGAVGKPARDIAGIEVLAAGALPELLAQSDFVVLALPLTRETEDLFDERMFAQMKRGSWLINIARGRLVDERALIRALRSGPMRGAVLDTLREEPLPPSSELYDQPNLIITPHTSWTSGRVLDRSIELFCDNLRRYRLGEPLRNAVDPALGY